MSHQDHMTPPGSMLLERYAPTGDGGRWVALVAAGAALGAGALVVPALLPPDDAFNFLAVLVAMIAGVYLGFALTDGRVRAALTEELGIVFFAVVATMALSTREPIWLAGGLFGHAAWDAMHHRRGLDTSMPRWYVPFCIGFDVVVALYVVIRF